MKNRLLLILTLVLSPTLHAQEVASKDFVAAHAQRTVVLYNTASPKSVELAEYYAKQRGIPKHLLVGVACSPHETISREDFQKSIEAPLQKHFTDQSWWKVEERGGKRMAVQVMPRFIAIMQGVPLRIEEQPVYGSDASGAKQKTPTPPAAGQANAASVDSELMVFGLLDRPLAGALNNPYFEKEAPFLTQPLAPFFMVSRIDGPGYEDAKRLIDDALAIEKIGLFGRAYIDLAQKNEPGYKAGEDWLIGSAKRLAEFGFPLSVDARAERFPQAYPMSDSAFYLGWYVNPPDGPFLNPTFRFKRGAVACHLHSFSATSVRNPKEGWVGMLISKGACAAFGNTFEPFLMLTVHFDKLTDRLLRGFTLAEASSMAQPGLSWMNVTIGDPLYRPFLAAPEAATLDPEFRALRQVFQAAPGTPIDPPALIKKLETLAEKSGSGLHYEALAQLAITNTPEDKARILKYYKSATAAFTKPEDLIRIVSHQAEFLYGTGERRKAIDLLEDGIAKYAVSPFVKSLQVRLEEIRGK
jgi:uncharacterized protein (TIGR03790 family)